MMPSRTLLIGGFVVLGMVLLTGCESRDAAAQKMLEQGQYQQVVDKYPDTQYARRAEALIAEKLLAEKQYDQVIENYPETPAAYRARQAGAQALFDAHDYDGVLKKYPHSAVAQQAQTIVADSLERVGAIDELIERFPESPQAKLAKEQRAVAAFEAAKKLKGKAQTDALTQIVNDYRGTQVYKEASALLRELRAPTTGRK